jgi:hypothetical protein
MPGIAIVGPQFSDPTLFAQWLIHRHQLHPEVSYVGPHDRIIEMALLDGITVRAAIPAFWDWPAVAENLLESPDAILLTLNRIDSLRRLNADVIAPVTRAAERLGIIPIVAANDPHHGSPGFEVVRADALRDEISESWPLFETTLGPFESRLRWSEGVDEAWDEVLQSALRRSTATDRRELPRGE